jgi:hypothetical protein
VLRGCQLAPPFVVRYGVPYTTAANVAGAWGLADILLMKAFAGRPVAASDHEAPPFVLLYTDEFVAIYNEPSPLTAKPERR